MSILILHCYTNQSFYKQNGGCVNGILWYGGRVDGLGIKVTKLLFFYTHQNCLKNFTCIMKHPGVWAQ